MNFLRIELEEPKEFENFLYQENENNSIENPNNFEFVNNNSTNENTYDRDNYNREKKLHIDYYAFELISKKKYYYTPKPKIKKEDESKIKIENNMLNKKHGRKAKNSNEKGERDKYAKDNIEKKIKTIFFKYCMDEIIKRTFGLNRKLPHVIKIDNNKVMKEVFFDYTIEDIYCLNKKIENLNENKKKLANMKIYQIFEHFINKNFSEFKNFGIYNIKPFEAYIDEIKEDDESYKKILKENFLNYLKVLKEGQTRKDRNVHDNLIERLKKLYNEN
jgi:hypothetical protein